MNSIILTLNRWAEPALGFAWPMLWQSSLLIGLLFILELVFRRKLRPSLRYALWLVALLKLALPPSLALPSGLGWWLRPAAVAPVPPRQVLMVVADGPIQAAQLPAPLSLVRVAPPPARLSAGARALAAWGGVSLGLLAWMLVRWRQVGREAARAVPAPDWLEELSIQARRLSGLKGPVRLRLTDRPMSPAVCGLLRPVILAPRALAEQLPPDQLRTVLVHELVHLRRGDLWLGLLQSLLQVLYWWHPPLWLANARIRRAREEAVDDAVVLALADDAGAYPPTLLEVARLALWRPRVSLGLLGMLESRSFLRQRIERLLDLGPPRRPGQALRSFLAVAAFAALALPMGQAPARAQKPALAAESAAPSPPSPPAVATGEKPEAGGAQATQPAPAAHITINSANVLDESRRKSARLLQDGKLLYEMGKLDEAEARLRLAKEEDPKNAAADYYLDLVAKARHQRALNEPNSPPRPAPNVVTNFTFPSRGRRVMAAKLDRIRLNEVGPFDDVPLSEVVKQLDEWARERDPEGHGINFIIAPYAGASSTTPAGPVQVDPATGLPIAAPVQVDPATGLPIAAQGAAAVDMNAVSVRLPSALYDIRLADLLEVVVKTASKPIKCSVEDYAVVFSPTGRVTVPLYFRTIKLDPNSFLRGIGLSDGSRQSLAGTNSTALIQAGIRDFFTRLGLDMSPPKTVFYGDREGTLLVYATLEDLDVIERALQVLNLGPCELDIEIVCLQLPKAEARAFWEKYGYTSQPASAGGAWTTTLPVAEAQAQLRRWKAAGDTNILSQPHVRAPDGQQTRVSLGYDPTIMTIDAQGHAKPEVVPRSNAFDLTPHVRPDRLGVQLDLVLSAVEFLGYDDPRAFGLTPPESGTNVMPHFRVAQAPASAKPLFGSAMVLGNLTPKDTYPLGDRVPGLAFIPLVQRLFRAGGSLTPDTESLVFLTPTLVEPAANPPRRPAGK